VLRMRVLQVVSFSSGAEAGLALTWINWAGPARRDDC
jgi:hypothetical protein